MNMDLPNYFLADLPDNSTLTPQLITDACQTIKNNRQKFLAPLSTAELIEIITRLAQDWLDPKFEYRKFLLDQPADRTGFPPEVLAAGLVHFFSQITRENLNALIIQDLGSVRRLDQFVADETERKQNRSSMAIGPELLVHITGGLLPNPTLTSMILGLLVRSAQFVKCASGTSFIPRIFAHSLYAAQPKLGACLEIAEWKGGNTALETPLFAEAACLTATGSDETVSLVRNAVPPQTRLVTYGHKLSFAFVTREALEKPEQLIPALVEDISAWNQLGCLSPHVIFVETRAALDPDQLAEKLARELAAREQTHPRGPVPPDVSAAITTRRMAYQVRASADGSTKIWSSENSTSWTVVHDTIPDFPISCLNRFIHVKPAESIDQLLAITEPLRGKISTVAIAAPVARFQELAMQFARAGLTRVCRAGQMQNPPLTWRHDGRPSLGDLVTWIDIEL